MKKEYKFDHESYEGRAAMPDGDRELAEKAREACWSAYAPYSHFRVGAAARLKSGKILTGSNQESEVFPATMCAERTLLFHWQAHFSGTGGSGGSGNPTDPHHPTDPIEAIAIASVPGVRECYPCGQCRQVLLDTERRQKSPIRIIMCSDTTASVVASAKELLPFQFEL